METKITIKGMHCKACKTLLEEICEEIDGVDSCKIDMKTEIATITHKKEINITTLKKEIESAGKYKVTT